VDEWKLRPERHDNHWLDCLAGCAVAASIQGAALPEHFSFMPHRNKVRLSDLTKNDVGSVPTPVSREVPATVEAPAKSRMKLSEIQKSRRY
jgi:hypothetical protein